MCREGRGVVSIPRYPFEATAEELAANIEYYVDSFISGLQSFFVVMPKGEGFVDFSRFQEAYEALRNGTANFDRVSVGCSSARSIGPGSTPNNPRFFSSGICLHDRRDDWRRN